MENAYLRDFLMFVAYAYRINKYGTGNIDLHRAVAYIFSWLYGFQSKEELERCLSKVLYLDPDIRYYAKIAKRLFKCRDKIKEQLLHIQSKNKLEEIIKSCDNM